MRTLSKIDLRIFQLLKILLAACLLTPLLAWSGTLFPYTAPKAFTFRVLVEIAAVLYLYLALKYPAYFLPTLKKGGWGGFLILSVLTFLVVNFLSALFGLDFYNSFWGNLERMEGIWGLAHFVAWFFMLVGVMNTDAILTPLAPLYKVGQNSCPPYARFLPLHPPYAKGGWGVRLVQVSVFTSIIVAASALVQRLGGLGALLPPVDRVYGTIGNAGFFAGYLIFNIFLAGYLFLESIGRVKWLFAISSLLLSISLVFSGTRGAVLGLAAGIIVFLVSNFLAPPFLKGGREGFKKPPAAFLVAIFILIFSLFLFRNSVLIKNNSTLSRLTSFSLSDITIQSRLLLWQESWRAWQSRPILGFGPENFSLAANKYFDARLAKYEAYSFDRAHNFIFDHGVETGWLGLSGYLMMIGAAGWALVLFVISAPHQVRDKLQRESEIPTSLSVKGGGEGFSSKPESRLTRLARRVGEARREDGMTENKKDGFLFSVIFLSLLVAYFVQNLFIFDSFVSYLMLFFALAIINDIYCYSSASVIPAEVVDPDARMAGIHPAAAGRVKSWMAKKIILIFFTVLIIFSLYSFNLKPFYAAYLANQILSLPAADAAQAVPLLKDALDLNTFASPEIAYQAAVDYIDKIAQEPALAQNEEFYGAASSALIKIIKNSPSQSRNYIALAWLDLYFSGKNPQRINEALSLGDKILALSPAKKDAFLILVAGYALSNQSQKAQEIILRAEVVDGKMGEEVREYYAKLK